jgi:hypothetical protein
MQPPQSLQTFIAEVAQIEATFAPIATELGMPRCAGAAS